MLKNNNQNPMVFPMISIITVNMLILYVLIGLFILFIEEPIKVSKEYGLPVMVFIITHILLLGLIAFMVHGSYILLCNLFKVNIGTLVKTSSFLKTTIVLYATFDIVNVIINPSYLLQKILIIIC